MCIHFYTGTNKSTDDLLNDHIIKVAPEWYHLGRRLLKEWWTHILNSIEKNNGGNAERCCDEMLGYWLNGCVATWSKLIDALEQIHQDVPVEMIKTDLDDSIKGSIMHTLVVTI